MALVKRVTKHGNSAGLIFDQPILKQMGWEIGSEVEIRVQDEKLILTSHRYADDTAVKDSTKRMITRHRKSLERLSR